MLAALIWLLPSVALKRFTLPGIHEVFFQNVRSEEHEPNGAGEQSKFDLLSCTHFIFIPQLEHVQDTQKVMCFVVASSTGSAFESRLLLLPQLTCASPGDGFVVTALTDAEYPRRAALSMCTSILQEFGIKFPNARAPVAWPQLDQYLSRCLRYMSSSA